VAQAERLTGTAVYRERLALPPNAIFEALLEDLSKADAASQIISSVRLDNPGQPPIRFHIEFDPQRITEQRSYSVRARITVGGRLWFLTDPAYPVLTRGHGNDVQMMLRRVGAAARSPSPEGAFLDALPASFVGRLPCADCPAIDYHINLFPDRVFFLRRTYQGRGDNAVFDDVGSWDLSSDGTRLVLKGGREPSELFLIRDPGTLRKLDLEGREIVSPHDYDLRRAKSLEPLEPRLNMRGMYRYQADAGLFTECLTRRTWPVAQEKDNATLEANYGKARSTPGQELLVNLEGQVAMRPQMDGGLQAALIVERFVGIRAGESCGPRFAAAPLENTYWKLTRLGKQSVGGARPGRDPHVVLQAKARLVTGSGGCNRIRGSYQVKGAEILFGPTAATRLACPDGMSTEAAFLGALKQTRKWRVLGEQLELLDNNETLLARFEARAPSSK
jgi:uncharacterized lipoprotein YbaY/heat shock protein HslJ/uncharacterized lipoprotein NlpE involved in copper resistance